MAATQPAGTCQGASALSSSEDRNATGIVATSSQWNSRMGIDFAKQVEADGDVKVAAMFRQIAVDKGTHYEA